MVRSRLDIWIPPGGAEVLLRIRYEVQEGTDVCISVSHVLGPCNLCFCQAYAVLSHTRLKLHPPTHFIPKELAHGLRQHQDEHEVFITWFVGFAFGNKGGENAMCENERERALVFVRSTTPDMWFVLLFVVHLEIGGCRDHRWRLHRECRKFVSDAFVRLERIFGMLTFVICSRAG